VSPIAVTLYDDAPVYGGAERYLELLATGFDRRAVLPSVVLAREGALDSLARRLAQAGVPVARLPRVPTLRSAGAFLRVFGHLAWKRPRILHFNLVDPRACNGAIVAAKLAGHSAIIATNQLPQSPFDELPTPKRHLVAMASIRHHVVVSQAARTDLLALGVPDRMISVIRNCTADPGPNTAARRAAARAALGAGPADLVVGFAGRLARQKDPALFVECAARVVRAEPRVRAVLVGDGPDRAALEEQAARLGARDGIAFLGHRDDAVDLYCGYDVMVFTSRYEGIPFSALEGMALGIPIVAARIKGIDEAVADGKSGRLVEGGADAFAAAVLALLADEGLRLAMGHAARLRVLEHFSVREMIAATTALYERTVGGR
jgi:glycosyltransferase involved in cell wall biosynthesis